MQFWFCMAWWRKGVSRGKKNRCMWAEASFEYLDLVIIENFTLQCQIMPQDLVGWAKNLKLSLVDVCYKSAPWSQLPSFSSNVCNKLRRGGQQKRQTPSTTTTLQWLFRWARGGHGAQCQGVFEPWEQNWKISHWCSIIIRQCYLNLQNNFKGELLLETSDGNLKISVIIPGICLTVLMWGVSKCLNVFKITLT